MHHRRHDAGHADEGEVAGAQFHAEAKVIAQVGEEEAGHASHVERGGEGAAHTAGAVGS